MKMDIMKWEEMVARDMKKHDFLFTKPAIRIVYPENTPVVTMSTGKCSAKINLFPPFYYFPPLSFQFLYYFISGITLLDILWVYPLIHIYVSVSTLLDAFSRSAIIPRFTVTSAILALER